MADRDGTSFPYLCHVHEKDIFETLELVFSIWDVDRPARIFVPYKAPVHPEQYVEEEYVGCREMDEADPAEPVLLTWLLLHPQCLRPSDQDTGRKQQ